MRIDLHLQRLQLCVLLQELSLIIILYQRLDLVCHHAELPDRDSDLVLSFHILFAERDL